MRKLSCKSWHLEVQFCKHLSVSPQKDHIILFNFYLIVNFFICMLLKFLIYAHRQKKIYIIIIIAILFNNVQISIFGVYEKSSIFYLFMSLLNLIYILNRRNQQMLLSLQNIFEDIKTIEKRPYRDARLELIVPSLRIITAYNIDNTIDFV